MTLFWSHFPPFSFISLFLLLLFHLFPFLSLSLFFGVHSINRIPLLIILQSLNLDGNGLSGIGKDFFKGLKSLEELQLSKNSLGPDLSENYFQDLKQLKALNLSHNNIASISRITFSSLELLSVLSLRDNDLGIEVNYNSLTELLISNKVNLKSNKFITELRIDGLRPWILPNLEYLDLGQNLFTIIRKERSPFSLSHRVTTSSSSTPSVDQIFSGSFSNGQIFTVPNDQSSGDRVISTEVNNNNYWSSLRELKLDHCGIEFIQDNSFNALSSLTVLRLQDNRLSVSAFFSLLFFPISSLSSVSPVFSVCLF